MNNEEIRKPEIADVKVKREEEFPEDPEKRFEAVFSAIGNSEAKCLTLLCLSQGPLTKDDLHRKFLAESGNIWKTNRAIQAQYCQETLIPIGLVAEADTLYYEASEYVTGFRLTEAGQKYGQPIAAYLLEKSTQQPYSLLEIFGPTAKGSGNTRSVLTRARLLEVLASMNDVSRTIDLSNQLGVHPAVIGKHLVHLSQLGLVEYEAVNSEKPGYAKYTLSQNAKESGVRPVLSYPRLTKEVYQLLLSQKTVDNSYLVQVLKNNYPNSAVESLRSQISVVLTGLTKQGICQPDLFVVGKIQSQVQITDSGKQVVSEIILPAKEALAENHQLLFQMKQIPWQNYAEEAVSKHKEASGNAKQRTVEKWAGEAFVIITQNPGIRPVEISKLLGRNSYTPVQVLLSQGKIRKEKQGRAVHYYPA